MSSDPEIGMRIRALREEKEYTRDALAERAEISTKFLYEIELGKKTFSVEILRRVANALDISSDYLLTGYANTKVPKSVLDLLEYFSPEQMDIVYEVLQNVWEICSCEKYDKAV